MAKPTIIANFGEGNVGKTDSIKRVYEKLCQVIGKNPGDLDKDICETIEINKIKIGIASDGDSIKIIEANLDRLAKANCRIILTACRSNHDSVVLLNEYKDNRNNKNKYKYRIWRTSNARIYEYIDQNNPRVAPKGMLNRFNDQWATEIANLIESWCYAGKDIAE